MSESRRTATRYTAAGLSAVVGVLYLLVGLNVLDVEGVTSGEQAAFAIPAAVIHFGGAFVALRWDKRWLWLTGTVGLGLNPGAAATFPLTLPGFPPSGFEKK